VLHQTSASEHSGMTAPVWLRLSLITQGFEFYATFGFSA
jgi:hypothetical protein